MSRALACYLHAGEVGYEVSQSNAAYVLKAKVLLQLPSSRLALTSAAASGGDSELNLRPAMSQRLQGGIQKIQQTAGITDGSELLCQASDCTAGSISVPQTLSNVSSALLHRLLSRQYGLTVFHGNKDNSLELGTCYFKG